MKRIFSLPEDPSISAEVIRSIGEPEQLSGILVRYGVTTGRGEDWDGIGISFSGLSKLAIEKNIGSKDPRSLIELLPAPFVPDFVRFKEFPVTHHAIRIVSAYVDKWYRGILVFTWRDAQTNVSFFMPKPDPETDNETRRGPRIEVCGHSGVQSILTSLRRFGIREWEPFNEASTLR